MQKETKRQLRFLRGASLTTSLNTNRLMDSHETFTDFSLDYKEKSVKVACEFIKRLACKKCSKRVIIATTTEGSTIPYATPSSTAADSANEVN